MEAKKLKKVNNARSKSVITLDLDLDKGCHCGCEGKPVSAAGNGYIGQFL